jgi:flagellar biosynthesis protein FlhB
MAEQELDRNEAATPFKLQKAREQGQTPRSADLVSSVVFLGAMLYLAGQAMGMAESLLKIMQSALMQAARAQAVSSLWPLEAEIATACFSVLLPFLLALPLLAILAAMAQTGFVFSWTPLHVDFNRISPATGFKRLFSMRTLFDGARAGMKLLVLSIVAVVALQALLPQFHAIAAMPAPAFLHAMAEDLSGLGLKMGLALVLVGLVDVLFTRREFSRNMRMSRRELKDEWKNREGDPRVRARLRELRRELLKRSQALRNTRTADVVVTNPTHYAVALRYVHGEMDAPQVVAKGAGQLAAAMREIAARHRIVVVQNPPLARRLFREVAIEEMIPSAFHAEVAKIIVWVLAMRRQQAAFTGGAA